MNGVQVVNKIKNCFVSDNFGGGINLKIQSCFEKTEVGGIAFVQRQVGSLNFDFFARVEELPSLSDLGEVELFQFVSEVIVEEIRDDELLVAVRDRTIGEVHGSNKTQF